MTSRRSKPDARPLSIRLRTLGRNALARRFGIDARALAALRISLGLLLLADLLLRARDLVAFYTDAGVLPRAALAEQFPAFARLSLHAVSGAVWMQAVLFLVAGGAAVSLLLGYRTRLATAASFVLLVSLHARDPLVLNAGDSLLRRLLFWGLFLPLGGRWSVDALRRGRAERRIANVATAALLVQVLLVYLVNAVVKLRGERWLRGDAVPYVFSLDQLTVLFGDTLASYPELLRVLGHVWLALVVGSGFLVILTGWSRALFVSLFVGAHLGMALTMMLGLFPLISIASLLPFLPAVFWDAAERRAAALERRIDGGRWHGVRVALSNRVSRLHSELSTAPPPARPAGRSVSSRRLFSSIVAALLVLVLLWNGMALGYVDTPDAVTATVDPAEYRWDMFAPNPRGVDGWYVVPAELESGERVDALHRSPVRWDRPPDATTTYANQRWLVYLLDLRYRYPDLRDEFADYLCRRWNALHEDDLVDLTVYYVEQPTRLHGPETTRRVKLLDHSCGRKSAGR